MRSNSTNLNYQIWLNTVSDESIAGEIEEICAHISGREIEEVDAGAFIKFMNAE
jgi:hypothetical protein